MADPIVDKTFLMEKRISKSGFKFSNWTYVAISNFPLDIAKEKGGTLKVKGFIDIGLLTLHRIPTLCVQTARSVKSC